MNRRSYLDVFWEGNSGHVIKRQKTERNNIENIFVSFISVSSLVAFWECSSHVLYYIKRRPKANRTVHPVKKNEGRKKSVFLIL